MITCYLIRRAAKERGAIQALELPLRLLRHHGDRLRPRLRYLEINPL
jgi:hypothetical protein